MPPADSASVRRWPDEIGVLSGLVGVFVFFGVLCAALGEPGTLGRFISAANLTNLLVQNSEIIIVAVGMTFVIVSAGIDLSVGSIVALTSVVIGVLVAPYGALPAIAAGLLAGTAVGAFNGAIVAWFDVPPFIVTLATMIGVRGLAFIVCDKATGSLSVSVSQTVIPLYIAKARVLGLVPVPIFVLALVFAGGVFVSQRTKFGRWTYAIGGNEEAAWLCGIPVRRVKIGIYALSGFLAALTGLIVLGRTYSGDPNHGNLYELDAIAASVVGGTSLAGGRGSILGALLGGLIIGVIINALAMLDVQSYPTMLIKGAIILVAVLLDQLRKRRG
jgi:ribose transport system permease protein